MRILRHQRLSISPLSKARDSGFAKELSKVPSQLRLPPEVAVSSAPAMPAQHSTDFDGRYPAAASMDLEGTPWSSQSCFPNRHNDDLNHGACLDSRTSIGLRSALVEHCKHWLYISIDDNMRSDSRSIYLTMPWVKHSDPHVKSNMTLLVGRFLVLGLAC
ncbi:Arginine metabolism regulation protein II [Fusarium oxysporum f. sp. albedinis]|nr:Arginine metabolism regulation protein II [Fusarium oxysporum f. sp. albedinis]